MGANEQAASLPLRSLAHMHTPHPVGIIGTNLVDAEQTVDTIVQRRGTLPAPPAVPSGGEGLLQLLQGRGVQVRVWVWGAGVFEGERTQQAWGALQTEGACRPPGAPLSHPPTHAPQVVSFADWMRVDAAEVAAGAVADPPKPREKMVNVGEMLRVAQGG